MNRWTVLILVLLGRALFSCEDSAPVPPPRPAADITVPPGLSIVADVSDSLIISGAALTGETATPLFRIRLAPRASQGLAAPAAPEGSGLRLRVAPAPTPQRGEEMAWIKTGAEGGPELPGTAAEYVYTGGDIVVRIARDESGKLVIAAAPASPGKK